MKEPLVSVIIPAYNASQTIAACLDSVCGQTYRNLEVIVVDDGSTDETFAIVQHYAEGHKNIPFKIYSIANSGPASARNYGIEHSTGEYIAFLDSDDRWASTKIERQIECFRKYSKIELLGCNYSVGIRNHSKSKEIKMISKELLLFKNFFVTPAVILKRNLLMNNRFQNGRRYSEDYYLWLQIACTNHSCAFLKESLVILCDKPTYGGTGLSAKLWLMEKGELENYTLLYNQHLISLVEYISASCFSFFKYCIRLVVTIVRKMHK